MLNKIISSKIPLLLLSIFFAIVLFLNAEYTYYRNHSTVTTVQTKTYGKTLDDVPIEFVNYDKDQYVLIPSQSTATVEISSANKLFFDVEANEESRQLRLVVDLSDVNPEETVTVPIKVEDVSSRVTANLPVDEVSVTLSEKISETYVVSAEFDVTQVADGYQLDSVEPQVGTVAISGDSLTLNRIHKVVADLSDLENVKKTQTVNADLIAYDEEGEILDVSFETDKIAVTLNISEYHKDVPLRLSVEGENNGSVSATIDQPTVTVYGPASVIDELSELSVAVDVSDVTESTTKTVKVTVDNKDIKVEPSEVEVNITVHE